MPCEQDPHQERPRIDEWASHRGATSQFAAAEADRGGRVGGHVENADFARVLSEIADILELTGGNALKVSAYRQAAQVVDLHPGPIAEEWRRGRLTELPGIGEAIAGKIGELVETGEYREHARLAAQEPPGVLEMLRLEGVGPLPEPRRRLARQRAPEPARMGAR